jgi:hypothetical protein
VRSFDRILRGAQRLALLYYALFRRMGAAVRYLPVRVNGEPGLARLVDGQLESVQAFGFEGDRIRTIHVQRNPDKLVAAAAVTNR